VVVVAEVLDHREDGVRHDDATQEDERDLLPLVGLGW